MNTWIIGKSSMKLYLKNSAFCSHLNMKAIADADYTHGKRVCKDFEIKKLVNKKNLYF